MTEDRIDLSPLDPTRDDERFDRIVASITDATALELARRRARTTPFGQIAAWRRPMLAAAAAVVVVSVTVLSRVGRPSAEPVDGVALAMGVPQGLAEWVMSDATPSPADLLTDFTLEEQ